MRTIERTGLFKKDFKRELKGPHRAELEPGGLFVRIVTALANDEPLPKDSVTTRSGATGRITGTATSGPILC